MDAGKDVHKPLVRVEDLRKEFPIKRGIVDALLKKPKESLTAVDDVTLDIYPGDNLGLVGESGCGKSTLAKTIIRLYQPDGGKIVFEGLDTTGLPQRELRRQARNIQMIFQDPYSSLNPRMSVRDMLREELRYHKMCPPDRMDARVAELLSLVGLQEYQADRFPGEFSGGQRQRIGIARALALEPKLIIADEPVSALDVSIQAQVINLLMELQQKLGLTILFISHDLRVVRYITNRVAVMYLGKIIELAPTEALYGAPSHPYTQILLQAAPRLEVRQDDRELISGDLPSPIDLPSGCRFHPRCPIARKNCKQEQPELQEIAPGHYSACFYSTQVQNTD